MDLGYHPAITDRLFLELNRDNFGYLVCSKSFAPLKSGSFDLIDEELLLSILDANPVFRQIFARVYVIVRGVDFVLIPQEELAPDCQRGIFRLNYPLSESESLTSSFVGNTVEVLYRTPGTLKVLTDHFPGPEVQHELVVFSKCWYSKAVNTGSSDLYASLSSGKLLLSIRSLGTLRFSNMFDVYDIEDIFYYCMLAIEQLELDIERCNIFWTLEDAHISFEVVKKRFDPFIANVRPYLFDLPNDLEDHPFVASRPGFKAMLQCAL